MTDVEHVLVPAFVGLEVAQAHELALSARVAVVGSDPDRPLPSTGIITAQRPRAGTQVLPGDAVTVWIRPEPDDGDDDGDGGGGGSARDPDRPRPLDPAGVKYPS